MTVYYFARVDLENALGVNTINTVYCDDASNVANVTAINACIAFGTAECNSFLRGIYPEAIPTTADNVPDELMFAALDFGIAYTIRRKPDVVYAMHEQSWTVFRDSAIEKMKRYVDALQRMPPAIGTPTNVGGEVVRTADPDDEPTCPRGSFWEDMGNFSR